MRKKIILCCFCGDKVERKIGNNPEPLEHAPKRCCDFCNITKVIPKRLENAGFIKKKIVFS